MSPADPDNSALDALYRRAQTHPETRLVLLKALLEYELYTIIPRGLSTRPAQQVQRPAPERKLEFPRWQTNTGDYFFVFTSAALARRGAKTYSDKSKSPYLIVGLPGELLLNRLLLPGTGICLNSGTGEIEMMFNDAVLRDVLNGAIFAAEATSTPATNRSSMRPLPVEEHPLSLVQPVFDHLKSCPQVMAAWVLAPDIYWDRGEKFYLFALLTSAEDTASLRRSIESVIGLVDYNQREGLQFGVTTLDYGDPAHAAMMRTVPPFYAAPGYQPAGE